MTHTNLPVILLKDFHFTTDILVFEPWNLDKKRFTLVKEVQQEYLVFASTKRVIRKCCATFGTSLEETTKLSKHITQAANKLPIAIGPTSKPFVLLPTLSPDRAYTRWISFDAILGFESGKPFDCPITLLNGEKYITNISTSSLQSQIARSLMVKRYYKSLNLKSMNSLANKEIMHIDRKSLERP